MNDTKDQNRKIDWFKSYRNLAIITWGILTYLALLGGTAWLAAATGGPNPKAVALLAVIWATSVNWILFGAIEWQTRN